MLTSFKTVFLLVRLNITYSQLVIFPTDLISFSYFQVWGCLWQFPNGQSLPLKFPARPADGVPGDGGGAPDPGGLVLPTSHQGGVVVPGPAALWMVCAPDTTWSAHGPEQCRGTGSGAQTGQSADGPGQVHVKSASSQRRVQCGQVWGRNGHKGRVCRREYSRSTWTWTPYE